MVWRRNGALYESVFYVDIEDLDPSRSALEGRPLLKRCLNFLRLMHKYRREEPVDYGAVMAMKATRALRETV